MSEWHVPGDLAGAPGMPVTVQAVTRRAKRESWRSRPRKVRGGGREYHVGSLPEVTQAWLLRRRLAPETPRQDLVAPPPALAPVVDDHAEPLTNATLTDRQRERALARLTVLRWVEDLATAEDIKLRSAMNGFIALVRAGRLTPEQQALVERANARRGRARVLTRSTLYRWMRERDGAPFGRGADLVPLAPKARHQRPLPAWLDPLMTHYGQPSKPALASAYRALNRDLSEADSTAELPCLRTVQRVVGALPAELREYGRKGRRAMRAIQPFVRRTSAGLWPMDVVTVDGHNAKCYVLRPDSGRRVRAELTTYLDVATRRVVGFSAWWAESQYAIWLALRAMVLDPRMGLDGVPNGVAAIQYSDNGAYRGQEHQAVLDRLGTDASYALPYRAQARGAIERLNSSLWIPLARTQPTYCGSDCDQEAFKKALKRADEGAGILEWEAWLEVCAEAIAEYNARPHEGLRLGRERLTPDQAWRIARDEGWAPTALEDDDLHELLPAVARRCNRGEVRLPWGRYQLDALRHYHGRDLRVAYDPADGARVWVSELGGRLIGEARRDAASAPYFHDSQVEHSRARREKARVERLQARIDTVQAEELPLIQGETYDLPDLVLNTHRTVIDYAPVVTPLAAREEPVALAREDDYLDRLASDPIRWDTWKILRDRDAAGDLISAREQEFVERWGRSIYCQTMLDMLAEFEERTGGSARAGVEEDGRD